jgi:hypothetical protein
MIRGSNTVGKRSQWKCAYNLRSDREFDTELPVAKYIFRGREGVGTKPGS